MGPQLWRMKEASVWREISHREVFAGGKSKKLRWQKKQVLNLRIFNKNLKIRKKMRKGN